jgi:hypothetical protein
LCFAQLWLQVVRDLKWAKESDVYSFGVLIFEVLSGAQLPFSELGNEALALKLNDPRFHLVNELFGDFSAVQEPLRRFLCGKEGVVGGGQGL